MRVVLGLLLLALVSVSGQEPQILNPDSSNTFHITQADGTTNYKFGDLIDPTLNMTIGQTYYISIEFDNTQPLPHPFGLNTKMGPAQGTQVVEEMGLVNNGSCTPSANGYSSSATTRCVLAFTPNATTPKPLYYHCGFHPEMWGLIQLNAPAASATTSPPTSPVNNATTAPPTLVPVNNATTAPPTNATNPPTTAAPAAPSINADSSGKFYVTGASGNQAWIFTSGSNPVNDPTLNMEYGKTYTISIEFDTVAGNHPFGLSRSNSGAIADLGLVNANTTCGTANNGFTATAAKKCTLTFTPPASTPQPLYYRCTVHPDMWGQIVVTGLPKSGGFALVPGVAALFAVVLGLFAAPQ